MNFKSYHRVGDAELVYKVLLRRCPIDIYSRHGIIWNIISTLLLLAKIRYGRHGRAKDSPTATVKFTQHIIVNPHKILVM